MSKIALIYIFALCLTEILGMTEEMQELIDQLHNTCVAETGASEEHIANARKGNFADDENFKCYFKCIFDQMGCMTEDGKVDVEATIAVMPPEVADQLAPIVRKCTDGFKSRELHARLHVLSDNFRERVAQQLKSADLLDQAPVTQPGSLTNATKQLNQRCISFRNSSLTISQNKK